ncbi:MAG: PSD1 and planctomycete cytochrome C domain-containing protein [Verrucomicrobiota bacterium]
MSIRCCCLPALLFLSLALAGSFAHAGDIEFFEKRIRPVLVERCYRCHSAESEKLKGGLRLDSREGILRGGESGQPAIVPGQPEASLLIEAIRYTNEDLRMPPKERLSETQVEDFAAWVKAGAPMPDPMAAKAGGLDRAENHWAFQPPRRVAPPKVRDESWIQTPIDRFILSALEAKGLKPSQSADKRTLLRRVTFDLTGLAPTASEMETFLNDASPGAYARTIDRLLASPHYGERWGRYWLDVARFADTKGYVYSDREEGRFVHSSAYRDWVIRALNEDMPYDLFLLLQIAGDQLVNANDARPRYAIDRDDLAAMGFVTLGRRFLGVVHDIIDDRIDTLMRGTQALTVSCARCHDHKFDPIPIQDYYSLYGVFAGGTEKMMSLSGDTRGEVYKLYEAGLKERIGKFNQTLEKKREEFSNRFRNKSSEYLVAVLDVKKLPTEEHYEIRGPDDLNPTVVRQWEAFLLQTRAGYHAVFAPWHELAKIPDREFPTHAPRALEQLQGNRESTSRVNPLVLRALTEKPLASMRQAAERYGELLARIHAEWQAQVQAAKTNQTSAPAELPDPDAEELRQVLYGPGSPVNIPLLAPADLEWYFDEPTRVELMKQAAEIERWIIKSPGAPPHAVILEDRPQQKNPRVFIRGNPANKGPEVPRQFLALLSGPKRQPFRQGSGRLELAQAIANRNNPLTARVMVNRVWLHHFGAGLVRTPSDFGTRSEPPSHPELLDWLAHWFMDQGWSLKQLHRLILLSSVYQQTSDPMASSKGGLSAQLDPENRLLWRMNRQRLDFEALRDALLQATGELDLRMGGASADLFKPPFNKRRTIYGLIDRQFLPGVFRVFDFANPDMHSPQRIGTTVPQQALFFMNSPFVVERARALMKRPEFNAAKDPEKRVDKLFQTLFQRSPTRAQMKSALAFLDSVESEPPLEPPPPKPSAWQYGFGEFDETAQRVKHFEALPHFTGDAWQGGPKWPDEKLGWVQLTAEGGHAGNDLQHAAIRRWTAPQDGRISISGAIHHEHEAGDGIRARIVSSRQGLLGAWEIHKNKKEVELKSVEVRKGDTLDFLVDIRGNLNSDMFKWAPVLKAELAPPPGSDAHYVSEWNARKEFAGPAPRPPEPLTAWEQYAQVLLLANEFVFVD